MNDNTNVSPYQAMSFPLNVYAYALQLEEGKADYLHYGLFKTDDCSLQEAQSYSTELILKRLPPPPCRILEVGVGLGTTFKLLLDKGYQIIGITPDQAQIDFIRSRLGDDAPVQCMSLEAYRDAAGGFDVILFQESAQYIDPLAIFNRALDLLRPGGSLLVVDEFALRRIEAGSEGLHRLDDFIAQAERFALELIERVDLSALAAPTLDYLLRVTVKHRQRLHDDLGVSEEELDQLDRSNTAYREKYANGRYGYALLHYRKTMLPKWRLRVLERGSHDAMLALFQHVFQQPMSAELWRWKYRDPQSQALCVWEDGRLIGHYAGMPRDILYLGRPARAVQIGDVMVEPSKRAILTRRGPFFLMASTFFERCVGFGRPFLLGFGFPTERAMKVAERLGLYAEVGRMTELSWPPMPARPFLFTNLCVIDKNTIETNADEINRLWKEMADDLQEAVVGVRDRAYLQSRYLNHPERDYRIVAIRNRLGCRLRGIIVLHFGERDCALLDVVAPLSDVPLSISHARRLSALNHCERLSCQITEAFADHFVSAECQRQALDVRIPADIWSEGPPLEDFRGRWWLMSGDMDCR